jgi:hypothetical protein
VLISVFLVFAWLSKNANSSSQQLLSIQNTTNWCSLGCQA